MRGHYRWFRIWIQRHDNLTSSLVVLVGRMSSQFNSHCRKISLWGHDVLYVSKETVFNIIFYFLFWETFYFKSNISFTFAKWPTMLGQYAEWRFKAARFVALEGTRNSNIPKFLEIDYYNNHYYRVLS